MLYLDLNHQQYKEEDNLDILIENFLSSNEELKRHYDGYHFSEECPDIYNPFSIFPVM